MVPKPDVSQASHILCPVQQQGQQFVLGQVHYRLRTQVVHAGTSLSLEQQTQMQWNDCMRMQVSDEAVTQYRGSLLMHA